MRKGTVGLTFSWYEVLTCALSLMAVIARQLAPKFAIERRCTWFELPSAKVTDPARSHEDS
jgi:hypothetical protein